MESIHPRIAREQNTIEKMVQLYCKEVHGQPGGAVCEECAALVQYALTRLHRCPFQEKKPTCAKCAIHCYQPGMREKIRNTMRYAGPRMLRRHPVLAVLHLADGMRKTPARKPRNR